MNNKNYYKGIDILNNSYKSRIDIISNPYLYNLESNIKDLDNIDLNRLKSISHEERNTKKKS